MGWSACIILLYIHVTSCNHIWGSTYMHKSNLQDYRKISNIRRTKSQNLNVSRLVLQLSLSNPMKPGVKSKMKM